MADTNPDTPVDPRSVANEVAMKAAGSFAKSVEPELRVSKLFALNVATKVVKALAEAGLLALPEQVAQDAEQVAIAALDRMGASPAWRNADARAIVRDLRAAGLLRVSPEDEGSLRSQASGTPVEAIAEALRDVTLNLGPNVLEAIYGGQNHLILSGAERHAIALTALKALGLEAS